MLEVCGGLRGVRRYLAKPRPREAGYVRHEGLPAGWAARWPRPCVVGCLARWCRGTQRGGIYGFQRRVLWTHRLSLAPRVVGRCFGCVPRVAGHCRGRGCGSRMLEVGGDLRGVCYCLAKPRPREAGYVRREGLPAGWAARWPRPCVVGCLARWCCGTQRGEIDGFQRRVHWTHRLSLAPREAGRCFGCVPRVAGHCLG